MNEVFLALMFAGNTAVLLVTAAKVRAWRKWIREHALEARVCEASARAHASAARAEADRAQNTAGRCSQLEISTRHAAERAARATGTDLAPACAPIAPRSNPTGLRIYGSDESDMRGTD